MDQKEQTVFCVAALAESASDWIMIIPTGQLATNDGRKFSVSDGEKVVQDSLEKAGGRDIPIDYEHQIDLATNGPVPAAGWMKELKFKDGAIFAKVEWTERAATMIKAKEYRYISPTFTHDENGEVSIILRAALVNSPALDMPSLAKSKPENQQMKMSEKMSGLMQRLMSKLGLTDSSTDEEMDAAMTKMEKMGGDDKGDDMNKKMMSSLASILQLPANATVEEINARMQAKLAGQAAESGDLEATDAAKALAKANADAAIISAASSNEAVRILAAQVATLSKKITTTSVEDKVDAAVKAGKITPASKLAMIDLCTGNAKAFDDFVKAAPVILDGDEIYTQDQNGEDDGKLSTAEKSVCKAMGISSADFIKRRTATALAKAEAIALS